MDNHFIVTLFAVYVYIRSKKMGGTNLVISDKDTNCRTL